MTDDDRFLARVRSLLAKAEHASTPPAEAEAMSEKAAELMARYALDRALVDAATPGSMGPQAREIRVDAPYATPKVLLLARVAAAYGVRAVVASDGEGRLCTLVGFECDIAVVELLFTSLLVQANFAMVEASHGQRRVRAFRHAFLLGYSATVGRRISEAQRRAVDEASSSGSPAAAVVLADRSKEVARAVGEMFPRLSPLRTTLSDGGGLEAGRAAGKRADITAGRRSVTAR